MSSALSIITATSITDAAGNPISGFFRAKPNQQFVVGGGGNAVTSAINYTITNGALQAGAVLADTSATQPLNVSYTVEIVNNARQVVATYPNFQPVGATYSFDTFVQVQPPYINADYIQPLFETNGVANASQSVLNLTGTGVSYVGGAVVIDAGTGSGGGAVSSVFGRTGAVVAAAGDYTAAEITGAAPLASPALTGVPTAPTATAATNTTQIATTAFTTAAVGVETTRAEAAEALLAPLASPTFTGTVTAPTFAGALTGNSTTSTTAGNVTGVVAVANGGTGTATPGLVAGANVAITGTWPDQTIAAAVAIPNITVTVPTGTLGPQAASASATTVSMPGVTTSGAGSHITTSYTGDPTALTGWGTVGGMSFVAWPSAAGVVSWKLVNATGASITYAAITISIGAQ